MPLNDWDEIRAENTGNALETQVEPCTEPESLRDSLTTSFSMPATEECPNPVKTPGA